MLLSILRKHLILYGERDLWQKVVKSGIRGKYFGILCNMYSVAKSLVFANDTKMYHLYYLLFS